MTFIEASLCAHWAKPFSCIISFNGPGAIGRVVVPVVMAGDGMAMGKARTRASVSSSSLQKFLPAFHLSCLDSLHIFFYVEVLF